MAEGGCSNFPGRGHSTSCVPPTLSAGHTASLASGSVTPLAEEATSCRRDAVEDWHADLSLLVDTDLRSCDTAGSC